MAFQVFHMEKRAVVTNGLNRHILREQVEVLPDGTFRREVWVPENADVEKTSNNVELVSHVSTGADGLGDYPAIQQLVDARLREAGVTPRRSQHTCFEVLFSGDNETMNAMSRDVLLAWSYDCLAWARKTFGDRNVVSATLHVDETTPHIHMIVVPLVSGQSRRSAYRQEKAVKAGKSLRTYNINHDRLRLCCDDFFLGGKFYEYHDSLAKEVSVRYGLTRGVKAEKGSKKTHKSSIEYNRQLEREAAETREILYNLTLDYAEMEDKVRSSAEKLVNMELEMDAQEASISMKESRIEALSLKEGSIIQRINSAQAEYSKIQATLLKSKQDILEVKAQSAVEKANRDAAEKQLKARAGDLKAPHRGTFGYKAEEVDSYIQRVEAASLVKAMKAEWPDINQAIEPYREEARRLQDIETKYNELMNSPELLEKRLRELKEQRNLEIKTTMEYILGRRIHLGKTEVHERSDGKGCDVFAFFRFANEETWYAAALSHSKRLSYTEDERIVDYASVKEYSKEVKWCCGKSFDEVKVEREAQNARQREGHTLNKRQR